MTSPGKMEKYARMGRITEIKKRLKSLNTQIIADATVTRSALFPMGGDIDAIKLDVARSQFEELEQAMEEYEKLKEQLKWMEEEEA